MIKIIFALTVIFSINAFSSFEDEGLSKRNCDSAKKEALLLAKTNCLSLDTQKKNEKFSKCRKDQQGYYKVKVNYKCDAQIEDLDDGYAETIDEDQGTYL